MSIEALHIEAVTGLPVSHVWRGHGSAIFLEFGDLSVQERRDGNGGQSSGELTLMIEWSWRISDSNSILAGSWSDECEWEACLHELIGSTVEEAELFGELPEILLRLSCGKRIASFMTSDGQPGWALISRKPRIGTLCVKDGALVIEEPSRG